MSHLHRVHQARIRHNSRPPEQMISAIVPGAGERRPPTPAPAPLPTLPSAAPIRDPDTLLIGIARFDRSGRVHERTLFTALGWSPGHELHLDTSHGFLIVTSVHDGQHRVDERGALALPAATRQICGIEPGPPVILAADLDKQLLFVHPAATVARLLAAHHNSLIDIPATDRPRRSTGDAR